MGVKIPMVLAMWWSFPKIGLNHISTPNSSTEKDPTCSMKFPPSSDINRGTPMTMETPEGG